MLIVLELFVFVGSLCNMCYVFVYGVDVVYVGQLCYLFCVRNNEFSFENLVIGIEEVYVLGKKFYVVSNIVLYNSKLGIYFKDILLVIVMKFDVLIMLDLGFIMMVCDVFFEIFIYLSVQVNVVNYVMVKFWQK